VEGIEELSEDMMRTGVKSELEELESQEAAGCARKLAFVVAEDVRRGRELRSVKSLQDPTSGIHLGSGL